MTANRFIRRGVATDLEPKLGRAFLVSLGLHLLVFLLFSGVILPRFGSDRRPIYYVDLVNLPVDKPQAGRPDAAPERPVQKKSPEKPAPKAPPVRQPEVVKKSEPAAKSEAVAPAKPAKPAVEKTGPSEAEIAERIAAMQQKQASRKEIEALKDKLAALSAQDTRGAEAAPEAPIGMPEGRGDEVGPSHLAWLQAFLKQQWALSEYQVTRLDLEATVQVEYDREGRMTDFRFLEKSGDKIFDESVRSAILKSRQLPKPPPVPNWQVEIVFNLKDLLDR